MSDSMFMKGRFVVDVPFAFVSTSSLHIGTITKSYCSRLLIITGAKSIIEIGRSIDTSRHL